MTTTGPTSQRESSDASYGVSIFAGVLLATVASFEILQGFSAVLNDDVFVSGLNYVYEIDVTAWGWYHLFMGAVGLAAGIGILKGQVWANSVGIGFAVVSALGQFAFMPYYPFWSLAIIAMNILVIWALAKQIQSGLDRQAPS